jgi:hypothetical protein
MLADGVNLTESQLYEVGSMVIKHIMHFLHSKLQILQTTGMLNIESNTTS